MTVGAERGGEDEHHAGRHDGFEVAECAEGERVGERCTQRDGRSGGDCVVADAGHRGDGRGELLDDESQIDAHQLERA